MSSEQKLSGEESLAIITEMIEKARGSIKGSAFHFILWGIVIALANFLHFYLMQYTDFHSPHLVWLITIPAWIASLWYGLTKGKKSNASTYSGNLIMWAWLSFSFTILILIFSGKFFMILASLIMIIAAIPTFLTGLIIKFKPLMFGGSLFWILGPIGLTLEPTQALLISGIGMIVGYLIPGILLQKS